MKSPIEPNRIRDATRQHYERRPFEFLGEQDPRSLAAEQPRPFFAFVREHLQPGMHILDLGCGPGRASAYLAGIGLTVTGVDLSPNALKLARGRGVQSLVEADLMQPPFVDAGVDAVIADGSLHHTPDAGAAFARCVRLLRPGGVAYIGLYKRASWYFFIYSLLGPPARAVARRPGGEWLLNVTLLPAYFLVHFIRSRGRRSWSGARNFFYDYLITPRASFHTREEVLSWAERDGMVVLRDDEKSLRNVHVFWLRKARVQ